MANLPYCPRCGGGWPQSGVFPSPLLTCSRARKAGAPGAPAEGLPKSILASQDGDPGGDTSNVSRLHESLRDLLGSSQSDGIPGQNAVEDLDRAAAACIVHVQRNPRSGAQELETLAGPDLDGAPDSLPPVDRAWAVSKAAHRGQRDRSGVPYVLHPQGVAAYLDSLEEYQALTEQEKEDAKAAAYLHDVLEDTAYTRDDLEALGFRREVLDAVDALTAPRGMPRDQYYERVKAAGRVAVAVKLADLGHNNLPARRAQLPGAPGHPVGPGQADQFTRLGKKYAKAYRAFGATVPDHLQPFAE